MVALNYGAAMVYPSEAFEPRAALEAVSQEKCAALYGVPTMFIAMLEELKKQLDELISTREVQVYLNQNRSNNR